MPKKPTFDFNMCAVEATVAHSPSDNARDNDSMSAGVLARNISIDSIINSLLPSAISYKNDKLRSGSIFGIRSYIIKIKFFLQPNYPEARFLAAIYFCLIPGVPGSALFLQAARG